MSLLPTTLTSFGNTAPLWPPVRNRTCQRALRLVAFILLSQPLSLLPQLAAAAEMKPLVIAAGPRHVRNGASREWSTFPESPQASSYEIDFDVRDPQNWRSLRIRQQNVKQTWQVVLNEHSLGTLTRDENDQQIAYDLPPELLKASGNRLRISTSATAADDIRCGPVELLPFTVQAWHSRAAIQCRIIDADSGETLPGRLTVTDANQTLQLIGTTSQTSTAVRAGVVFCLGEATVPVAPGRLTLYAGRGFEYSRDVQQVDLAAGETKRLTFRIRREVDTSGWVSCDTHVHTLTHSGHGDASITERMVTLAAEGIELPIATDHNKHIDYRPVQHQTGTNRYFTPVVGNEFTTRIGHFNIFPVEADALPPDHTATDWPTLFDNIQATPDVAVIILNHARDIHSGFRPFGPRHHHGICGRNLDGWSLKANAMEVVNSGAQQTDIELLFRDWMGLLNAGHWITPVGSSDSHDVARHFVGQGRTYVAAEDALPGQIDVAAAVASLRAGRVLVSCGLLTQISVGNGHGPGMLARAEQGAVSVEVQVAGPSWVRAEEVTLYANGLEIRRHVLPPTDGNQGGTKCRLTWQIEGLPHDVFLTAIATGPGVVSPHWPTARPYQAVSPVWTPRVIGCSGAVRVDVDGDGRWSAARELAQSALKAVPTDRTQQVLEALRGLDAAAVAQAFCELQLDGTTVTDDSWSTPARSAPGAIRAGYELFAEDWRRHERAVVEGRE